MKSSGKWRGQFLDIQVQHAQREGNRPTCWIKKLCVDSANFSFGGWASKVGVISNAFEKKETK